MLVMKDEIRRIARKEIKSAISGLKKDRIVLRKAVAALQRQAKQDRKTIDVLTEAAARQVKQVVPAIKVRITARGVRALRRKLKLSQTDFGKLVGVSSLTVGRMEKHQGPLTLRENTRQAFLGILGIGKKEAQLRLDQMTPKVAKQDAPKVKQSKKPAKRRKAS